MKGSKQLAAVALVTVGLAGAGVAVAAVTTSSDDVVTEPTTTLAGPTTTTAPATTTTTAAPDVGESPDTERADGTARSAEGCDGEEYANHGEYVSSVARADDRQPGDVPEAAHSPCGKPLTSVQAQEPSDVEPEDAVGDAAGQQPTGAPSGHGPAATPGKALGHGRS